MQRPRRSLVPPLPYAKGQQQRKGDEGNDPLCDTHREDEPTEASEDIIILFTSELPVR